MIEREQKHPAGTFARCTDCRSEPRHVLTLGRSNHEGAVPMGPGGTRHHLECPCGRRTARKVTLEAAVADWGGQSQLRLPLQVVRAKGRAAA